MPLQDQNIPIEFGQGLDTKSDPKAVKAKLLQLQDAYFTQAGALDKRNGYTALTSNIVGGGSLSAPTMMASFQNQLVCQDQTSLYSYSPTVPGWANEGYYVSCKAETQVISAGPTSQTLQSSSLLNNYALYAWDQDKAALVTLQDTVSGAPLLTASSPDNGAGTAVNVFQAPKTFASGSGGTAQLAVVIPDTSELLQLYTYAVSGASVVKSGPFNISYGQAVVNTPGSPATGVQAPLYDVANTTTGGVAAFVTSATHVVLKSFTTGGTLVASNNFTISSVTINGVILCTDVSNGNIWVYVATYTGAVYYAVYDSALTQIKAPTNIVTASGNPIFQLTAITTAANTQEFFYSVFNGVFSGGGTTDIHYGTATTSAGTDLGVMIKNLDISTKPFIVNSNVYLGCVYRYVGIASSSGTTITLEQYQALQSTYFIVAANGSTVTDQTKVPTVAKVFSGEAYGQSASGGSPHTTATNTAPCGFVAPALAQSSNKYAFLLPQVITVVYNSTSGSNVQVAQSSLASFDFAAADTYQGLQSDNSLTLNGGILWGYDGSSVTELGFNVYPEFVSADAGSTGGTWPTGTYSFATLFQWTDSQGNYHQSAPNYISLTITSGYVVTLVVRVPSVSVKISPSPPRVAIYATQANEGFYTLLDSTTVYSRNTASVTLVYANPASPSAGALYTNGGVIENIAPPPALALTSYNNRIWAIDTTNPNTLWYTKTIQPGVGLSFSDLLTEQVNAIGGSCVAIAGMDSNLVVFEQNLPLVIQGDGNNDAGTGSTLTPAQPIPSDAGCTGSKGIIVYPQGILRKTSKGIYRLDRSLSDKYWGFPVERYNSQTITNTTLIQDKTQIRFLCSSGLTLVYDYFFDQWGTFSNHIGYSATVWQGNYVYARTDGAVYKETSGYYLDNLTAITPLIQSGWLAMSSIQNFERVRELLMLGTFAGSASGHGIQVSFGYNFNQSFQAITPYYLTNADNPPVYQFRGFLPYQKCDSVSILIQEITTGDSTESITFTDMSFEAGVKKGLNKIKAAGSVG